MNPNFPNRVDIHVHQFKGKEFIRGRRFQVISSDTVKELRSLVLVAADNNASTVGQAILNTIHNCQYEVDVSDIYDEKKKITRKFQYDEILLATKSNWRTLAWEGKTVGTTIKDQQAEIRPHILEYYPMGIGGQDEDTHIMSSLDPEELGSKVLQGLSLYKIDPKVQKRIDETRRKQALRREERAKLKAEKLKNS